MSESANDYGRYTPWALLSPAPTAPRRADRATAHALSLAPAL